MSEERYGKDRIKKGLLHFLLGKAFSSLASFFAMILVIRSLSVEDFGAYSVLIAFVEILTALSGFGFAHVLMRYVPELYLQHFRLALRGLIISAVTWRSCLLVTASILAFIFSENLVPLVGLSNQVLAFEVFLLVVVLRSTTYFLSQILESTLHQGPNQLAFSIGALSRLLGMGYLLLHGRTDLLDVIWVEALSDGLSLLVVFIGVLLVVGQQNKTDSHEGDRNWLHDNFSKLARFAMSGYAQNLAILPYGGPSNRLLAGHFLGSVPLANFGIAQSLYEYVKRYLPAQLLIGMIRPIVIARYCESRDFSVAANICNRVFQINILLIGWIFSMLIASGVEVFQWISAGKYGLNAAILFGLMLAVLLLETQRQQLELLCQTVEQYKQLIPSNFLLSSSLLLSILLIPFYGAIAIPVVSILGLIVANFFVKWRLKLNGYIFRHDWPFTIKIIVLVLVSGGFGYVVKNIGMPWWIALLSAALAYLMVSFFLGIRVALSFARTLTRSDKSTIPSVDSSAEYNSTKIAFGILSSKNSTSAVEEIARFVFPHSVYVHHDFSKQPNFCPSGENVHVLRDPVRTAWGDWSLVAATHLLMKAALADPSITHFQLLSEACLPVKPISEFEDYLRVKKPDFMLDVASLNDASLNVSHGWRYFSNNIYIRRLLRKACFLVIGESGNYQQIASVNCQFETPSPIGVDWGKKLISKLIIKIFSSDFEENLQSLGLKESAIGSQWFGASRRGASWLLASQSSFSGFSKYSEHCHIPDEFYFQTLIWNARLFGLPLSIMPSNHFTSWKSCSTGPDILTEKDFQDIRNSGRFFARKFDIDHATHVRAKVLAGL